MMRSKVLEIVVFLMDNVQDFDSWMTDADDISETLQDMGYSENDIGSAYEWLASRLHEQGERQFTGFSHIPPMRRILSDAEKRFWTHEAHTFLLKLMHSNLVDNEQLETIIDRSALFGSRTVTLERAQGVASSVLFRDLEELEELMDIGSDDSSPMIH
jgi:uncharacterized protein Smg (DUF494 family)